MRSRLQTRFNMYALELLKTHKVKAEKENIENFLTSKQKRFSNVSSIFCSKQQFTYYLSRSLNYLYFTLKALE